MAERAPTDAEAQEGYNPTSSGGFDAKAEDFDHEFRQHKPGFSNVFNTPGFDPEKLGLPKNFNLMSYSQLRGSGAKAPANQVEALLKNIGSQDHIGGDVAIVRSNLYDPYLLVSTVDYFYSPVEDPYMTGWIAASNMASDMYAAGVQYIDNVLMSLCASSEMPEKERFICTKLMMLGFDHCVKDQLNGVVTGGQSIMNPWPILGGIAKSIVKEEDLIRPWNGEPGDKIVLTKPLGTHQMTDARAWSKDDANSVKIRKTLTDAQIERGYRIAEASMARTNRNACVLMHKYGAHGATDVSGYGPVGEAKKLVKTQKKAVDFRIDTLPVIKEALKVDAAHPSDLRRGYCPETSGGLIVLLPGNVANDYCAELKRLDGWDSYIIGEVVSGSRKVFVTPTPKIVEV